MMSSLAKGFEWLLDLAEKAEESENKTYNKVMRLTIKDKVACGYSIWVRVGLNSSPLRLTEKENNFFP